MLNTNIEVLEISVWRNLPIYLIIAEVTFHDLSSETAFAPYYPCTSDPLADLPPMAKISVEHLKNGALV